CPLPGSDDARAGTGPSTDQSSNGRAASTRASPACEWSSGLWFWSIRLTGRAFRHGIAFAAILLTDPLSLTGIAAGVAAMSHLRGPLREPSPASGTRMRAGRGTTITQVADLRRAQVTRSLASWRQVGPPE